MGGVALKSPVRLAEAVRWWKLFQSQNLHSGVGIKLLTNNSVCPAGMALDVDWLRVRTVQRTFAVGCRPMCANRHSNSGAGIFMRTHNACNKQRGWYKICFLVCRSHRSSFELGGRAQSQIVSGRIGAMYNKLRKSPAINPRTGDKLFVRRRKLIAPFIENNCHTTASTVDNEWPD